MAEEVASIGVKFETDEIARGKASLEALAQQGPKVEKAMAGVEGAATKTGKSLKTLAEGSSRGLEDISKSAPQAADGIGRVAKSADDAKRALSGINASVASLGQVSVAAGQSARGMASFNSGLQSSQRTLLDMQAQLRSASDAVDQMGSVMSSAIPSMQAVAKAQADAARSAAEMASAFKSAGDQAKSYGASTQQALAATKDSTAGAAEAFGILRTAMAGLASIAIAKQFATMADSMTNINSRLKLVTASSQELARVQADLFTVAQSTRIRFADLVDTYAQMARATKELGISQRDMLKVTETISQAVTISGGSAASAQAALVQLSQGFSSGALRGEELNSVLEQTPRLAQAIAQGLGVGIGELRKLGAEGELTAEKVLGALQKSSAQVKTEFDQMTVTIEQSLTRVGNSVMNLVGTVDQLAGASSGVAGVFSRFSRNLDALDGQVKTMASTNGLSDFFFSAFNTEERLNEELAITQSELNSLKAKLEVNPSNIYLKSAAADAQALVTQINSAITRLGVLKQAGGAAAAGANGDPYNDGAAYADYQKQVKDREDAAKRMAEITSRQGGFTKQFLVDLKTYQDALKTGVITEKEYAEAVTQANKKRYESTEAGKEAAKASKAGASAAKSEQSEYQRLVATIQAKIDANKAELFSGGQLTESTKLRIKLEAELEAGAKKMSAARRAEAQRLLKELKDQEDEEKAIKRAITLNDERIAQSQELAQAEAEMQKRVDAVRMSIHDYSLAVSDSIEMANLEVQTLGMTNVARNTLIEQLRIEQDLRKRIEAIKAAPYASQEARDADIATVTAEATKAKANAQTKAYVSEWEKAFDQSSQALTDALMRGGKNAGEYLKDYFRTLVLRPVIQAIVSPVAGSIASAITSVMGGSQPGGAAAGLVQNGLSIASLGKNISGAITGGFEALGGQVATYVQSGMNMLSGSGGAVWQGPVQVGGVAQGVGAAAGVAAGVAGGVYGGRLISGGYSAFGGASGNSAVNTGTAVGAAIGSIVPVIGTALGALVGGLLGGTVNRLFGRKLKDQGIEGAFGGEEAFEGNSYKFMKGGWFRSDKTERSALDEELRKGLADQFSVMRLSASAMAEVLGLGTAAIEGFTSSIKVSFNGLSEDEIEKRLTEEFDKVAESLAGVALGTTDYTKAGETAVQSLARLSGSLTAVNGVFDQLSTTLYASSLAGADMASSLLDLFGGADGFGTATGTYFQNFYSGEEQRDALERQLNAALAKVNLQLPDIDQDTAREQYRALADAQDLTTESGRKAWATLMQLAGSFAQLTKSADDVAAAAEEAGKSMVGLLSERRQLEAELLNAQGDAAGYAAAMRAIATEGYTPAEIAAWDYNEALRTQISNLEKAAEASAALSSSLVGLEGRFAGGGFALQYQAGDLAGQVQGLFAGIGIEKDVGVLAGQILSATSGEVEDFFRSMWGMLPTDEARQELVNVTGALLDLAGTAEATAKAVSQERMGLEQRLLQSLGATEELRRRELAALDPSNRALQQLIYGIEDLQSAATTAAQEAAAAWQNWGTAAGLGATYLGDTSGLEARRAILGAQIAASTDPADRLSKLQELISVEQAIGQAQQASRKTELEAISARQSALQKEVASAQQLLSAAQGLGSYVQSLRLSEASGLSDADRLGALGSEYTSLVGKARGGDADALQRLQSVAGDYLGLSQTLSASGSDYSVLAGRVSAELEAVSKAQELVAQSQVTGYEAQIAQLAQQSEYLSAQVELSDGTKSLIAKSMIDQAEVWDRENTQSLTLQELQQRAVDSLNLMPAGIASAIKPTIESSATYLANSLGGTVSSALSSLAGLLGMDGSHAAGLAFVPRDGYRAELHYGERVLTAEENRAYSAPQPFVMQSMGNGTARLEALVERQTQYIAKLESRLAVIEANTGGLYDLTDQKSEGGNADRVELMNVDSLASAIAEKMKETA